MTQSPYNVVWILGAGFSRSLGGPLLPRLLSASAQLDLEAHYEGQLDLTGGEGQLVRGLYLHGCDYKFGRLIPEEHVAGVQLWEHAEEFLEQLNLAAAKPDSGSARRIQKTLEKYPHRARFVGNVEPPSLDRLAVAARRLVAAECSAFLRDADIESEKWMPYRKWAKVLGAADTVVTFNYDRMLEHLQPGTNLKVLTVAASKVCGAEPGLARVLKLHGSVDWACESTGAGPAKIAVAAEDFAVTCEAREKVVMGLPGPSKMAMTGKGALLAPLWSEARDAIKNAHVIVFLGYRFPPSDAFAREYLLRALASVQGPGVLQVRVVLGPDVNQPDVVRMLGLLRGVMESSGRVDNDRVPAPRDHAMRFRLRAEPFLAEDFLTVLDREVLTSPERPSQHPVGPMVR